MAQGIDEVTVIPTRVFRNSSTEEGEEVRVEVSAPESTRFIEALMAADFFDPRQYSIVSDEVVAIISQETPERVTRPFKLSAPAHGRGLVARQLRTFRENRLSRPPAAARMTGGV